MAAWTPGSRAATPSRLSRSLPRGILSSPLPRPLLSPPPPMADWPPGCGRRSSAPPGNLGSPLLAPSAPSGGTWGDASPQTPAKRTSRASSDLEMGGCPRPPRPRSPSMRRVCLSHQRRSLTLTRSPVLAPLSATRSVWRGSGGRHLPRLPPRRAGPPAAAGGPVSHGRGGEKRARAREKALMEGVEGAREAAPPEWAIATHPVTVDDSGTTGFTLTVTVPRYRLGPAGGIA